MSRQIALVLLLLWSLAQANNDCVTSLKIITDNEIRLAIYRKDTSKLRRYILCPNTVFPVGISIENDNDDGFHYTNDNFPLVLLNPNVMVQCGENGSSRNNCTITGGDQQVMALSTDSLPPMLQGNSHINPDISNFTLRGVTLQGASDLALTIFSVGQNVLIEDCIFQTSVTGNFVLYFDAPMEESANRMLSSSSTLRRLDDLEYSVSWTPLLDVTIRYCEFQQNQKGLGIIGSIGNANIVVENNRFSDNIVPQRSDNVGSILWFTDGGGSIDNNCFFDNQYGLATILVNGGQFVFQGNFEDDILRTQQLGCNHLLFVDQSTTLGIALITETFRCMYFTAQSCPIVTREATAPIQVKSSSASLTPFVTVGTVYTTILAWVATHLL